MTRSQVGSIRQVTRASTVRFRLFGAGIAGLALVSAGLVAAAPPAAAATANPAPTAGARHNATRLPFTVSGTANLGVDVGTGNALFSDQLLTLPGVTADVPVVLSFNQSLLFSQVPSAVTGTTGSGWSITGFDQRLVANSDGSVTFYGPSGLTGVFTKTSTGAYVTPAQFRATLASVSGGWTLTDHGSGSVSRFTSAGRLGSVTDRNGNATTFAYTSTGLPASITSTRGASAARTVTIGTSGNAITSLTQGSGSLARTVTLGYSGGQLGSVTAADGGVTRFSSANSGATVSMTGPEGMVTTVDTTSGKATTVTQTNTATGSPGSSVTRISYPSTTQTLVADPTTNQSASVSSVPHTTYTLTTAQLVSAATDPDGHQRSATYTSLGNVASATPAAGGTTTYSYGANSGESLTSAASPGGATASAAYANTGASQYLPSSATNDAGNATKYSYNGTGNQLTTAQGTGPSATLTYNSDGTVATSASPGAASGVVTRYGYDSTHNLSSTTPPSGTSLGARAYTWDSFGRLATATDGRGNTTTYTYDAADRITKVSYSDPATHAVTYAYDHLGRVTSRVDGNGTTTYTWDSLGHLLSTSNTAGGGTVSYRYDKAGALASETDRRGTTRYTYDAAHELTGMTYPAKAGTTATIAFANDAAGRRTDTWLASNADHSTWAAHTQLGYDASGRVTRVQAQTDSSKPYSVEDQTYCYAAGSTAPTCSTSPSADRSKIQWISDVKTGETTAYSYDGLGRLTKAAVTGGSNPRTFSYTYDATGNRLTSTVTGSGASSQSLSFNAANQISTTGYTYDGAGNLTKLPSGVRLGYNSAGQRISATNTTGTPTDTYTYGGTGQAELLSQTASGGDTYKYAYGRTDSSGVPQIEEVTLTTGGTTYQAYVAHDPAGQPIALQTSTGAVALYVYDGRHNPQALVTDYPSVAYVYRFDPYGSATTTQNTGGTGYPQNPYVFAGGLQDRDTGLIRYGARWYNPATGTWLEQDTLNAPLDPANANRYAYVGGDPINGIDPTGQSFGDVLAGVGLAVGIAGLTTLTAGVGTVPALIAVAGFEGGVAGAAYQYGNDITGHSD